MSLYHILAIFVVFPTFSLLHLWWWTVISDLWHYCTEYDVLKPQMMDSNFLASSVQLLSHVPLFETPWIPALQASLSITNSRSSLKLMSIESVLPSSHFILCHPLLLLPPILPSIRVFSNESTLRMRWPKYWSFSFSISPFKEHPGLISFRMDWLDLCISEMIDISPGNLDSSLCFFQSSISHDVLCLEVK